MSRLESPVMYTTNNTTQSLVYEAHNLPEGLLVFAKGLPTLDKKGRVPAVAKIDCVFGNGVRTQVLSACQEGILCKIPDHSKEESNLEGSKVTLRIAGENMKSVAVIDKLNPVFQVSQEETVQKKHYLCLCTVLWNGSKFLREWVMYHAHLGVEKVFLYDNNSNDNLEETINDLNEYNVTRYYWPWLKAQESGFSHCAVKSSKDCDFTAFLDVDEFLFPREFLGQNVKKRRRGKHQKEREESNISPGRALIESAGKSLPEGKKLGAVLIKCFSFGPSGLSKLPASGQAVNYVCRERGADRHKSIVKTDALSGTRCNRIHHFELDGSRGYEAVGIRRISAVIHHFKYPVWDDFKLKFERRVSTYVTDWKDESTLKMRDRPAELGTMAVKPDSWERDHCYINDTDLRDYVVDVFFNKKTNRFPWQP